jgi:NADPH-dependent 2,4-dienoyl-CoA reductase/sulfur reductase-like enzyme
MGQSVSSISKVGERLRLEGDNAFSCDADMILVAVGARPETKFALEAGVAPGLKGALKVNRRMETNVPNIYAAGDCVETWHRITQSNSYLPLGTTSHKQGQVAGENAVGRNRLFEGSSGTQSVRLFDYVVARTGFHDRDARKARFDALSIDSVVWDHKVYYPGAKEMVIRVTGDRASSRLLGAQIIGHYHTEVSKRIDVFAAAIHHNMSVEEVSDLDLSYTPPLSGPWDPVQIATQA